MLLVALLAALAYAGVQLWWAGRDLVRAQEAGSRLTAAVERGDRAEARAALVRLREAAGSAEGRMGGSAWVALEWAPYLGDDVSALRAVARSLDLVAERGMPPLTDVGMRLDRVTVDRRIDVELLRDLRGPVEESLRAFEDGGALVADVETGGLVGPLRGPVEDYLAFVGGTERGLGSASVALEVAPDMLGAEEPRDYLLVFQNNAEVRATGGLPGSWARVHAEDGRLTMEEQGSGGQFGRRATPVLPLTPYERRLYGPQLGTYFRDANFTPDFPRAAELLAARWTEAYPATRLDGVLAVDTVSLAYVLGAVGPVRVGDATLTSDNAVRVLLRDVYALLDPAEQDAAYQASARTVFDAMLEDPAAVPDLVTAVDRAADERRLLVHSFHEDEARALAGSRVAGVIPGADGDTPHVDLTLNDATGSKMSYYLRHRLEARSTGCDEGRQSLVTRLTLDQTLPAARARSLPPRVTGAGDFGTPPGKQLVVVRGYGPYGGTLERLEIDGRSVLRLADPLDAAGRPAATVAVLVDGEEPVRVDWAWETAEGQTGAADVRATPGVRPGSLDVLVPTACR